MNCLHGEIGLNNFPDLVLFDVCIFNLLANDVDCHQEYCRNASPNTEFWIVVAFSKEAVLNHFLFVNFGLVESLQSNDGVCDHLDVDLFLTTGRVLVIALIITVLVLLHLLSIILVLLVIVMNFHAFVLQRMQLDLLRVLLHQEDACEHLRIQGLVSLTEECVDGITVRRKIVEILIRQNVVLDIQIPKLARRSLDIIKVSVGVYFECLHEA